MQTILIVIGAILVVGFVLTTSRARQFTIYMANDDVMHLYRRWYDFWLFDSAGFQTFRDDQGRVVRVNRHYTLKVVHGIDLIVK